MGTIMTFHLGTKSQYSYDKTQITKKKIYTFHRYSFQFKWTKQLISLIKCEGYIYFQSVTVVFFMKMQWFIFQQLLDRM